MSDLTPYDTGARLEPEIWTVAGIANMPGRYGKVDFDTDDGTTAVTVWVEPDGRGGFLVKVQPHTDLVGVTMLRLDAGEEPHQNDPSTWKVRQSFGTAFGGWNIVNAEDAVVRKNDGTPLNFRTREQARRELVHLRKQGGL